MTDPNPAIGALKSEDSIFASSPSSLIVVYKYLMASALACEVTTATHVQIIGMADLGIPPPSSDILMVISSEPSTTTTRIGEKLSSLSAPKRSTTARKEFLRSSKQMWERWPGT